MPKLKTKKSAAKRLKKTGTGKYVHHKAGSRHLMTTSKNSKRKRRLGKSGEIKATEHKRIEGCLPYGLK